MISRDNKWWFVLPTRGRGVGNLRAKDKLLTVHRRTTPRRRRLLIPTHQQPTKRLLADTILGREEGIRGEEHGPGYPQVVLHTPWLDSSIDLVAAEEHVYAVLEGVLVGQGVWQGTTR